MRTLPAIGLHELESQTAQLLPRRETLCDFGCVNVTNVVGVNLALALNAATVGSSAGAVAQQYLSAVQY